MRFHRSVILVLLVFTFQCHLSDVLGNIPSTLLEESVKLKLRTAASLRDNVVKIFNQLQSSNYELNNSIQQIRKYFKYGGSLIDCLHVLPTLSYVSVERQMNGILTAMEERSPRYLLPAISVIRNAFSNPSDLLNIEDVLQPNGGPLRIDIFQGILAQDLPKLTLPTPFPKTAESNIAHGLWPNFIEKVMASISMGFLNHTASLIGHLLENLISFNHSPHWMESVKQLTNNSSDSDENFEALKLDSDPYILIKNVLSSIDKSSRIRTIAESILPHLNENSKAKEKLPKLAGFLVEERMNYSLLLLNDKRLMKTKSAKTLLSFIQNDKGLLKNGFDDFSLYEYPTPDDLLMAFVSKLRRYQTQEGTVSEVIENVYAELIRKSHHADWNQLPSSSRAVKALLYSMKIDSNSPKIRRLATDVSASIEVNVEPQAWSKVLSYIPNVNCYGPSCSVLQTLEAIQKTQAVKDPALNASITELVKMYKQLYEDDIFDSCPNISIDNSLQDSKSIKPLNKTLNVGDLMQAIPSLDIKSKEYRILRDFLSGRDIEKQIGGNIDVEAHPTRGRLLAWLLGKIERLSSVEEVRNAAVQFVDLIAYDGYGAAAVLFSSA